MFQKATVPGTKKPTKRPSNAPDKNSVHTGLSLKDRTVRVRISDETFGPKHTIGSLMRNLLPAGSMLLLISCSPSAPVVDFASENVIAIRYSAFDSVVTLTAEAREMAVQHCARYGRFANYKGGNSVNELSAEEIHQFACERTKTDDSAVIAAQSQRPSYVAIPTYDAPRQTSCTTVGVSTNCYSY